MPDPTISIVIRTQNEERWVSPCLQAVFDQEYKDFEVVIVDNQSTDATVAKAQQFPVRVVTIEEYQPGRALNVGFKACAGRYVVCLSAHCIPADSVWLERLVAGFEDENIAGVYGRQQPMTFSSPEDKRDLLITFGLDRRIQERDPFFHNANSVIRRDVWEQIPFDETVTNIEDRIWAGRVLGQGYKILYEPEASVYHYHGIHQRGNEKRARTTVQVLEHLHGEDGDYDHGLLDAQKLRIAALVPVKGIGVVADGCPVLQHTLEHALTCRHIDETFVLTDCEETADFAQSRGATIPFLREPAYSKDHVDLNAVYAYCIQKMEEQGFYADLVVAMEPTYPFRPAGLIEDLIAQLLTGGYDSVLPVRTEYNSCWIDEDEERTRIDTGDIPRYLKTPVMVGLKGLACVTHPEFMRDGRLLGDSVGLVQIDDPYAALEVRTERDIALMELMQQTRELAE
jgi:rhamnosyltransferase